MPPQKKNMGREKIAEERPDRKCFSYLGFGLSSLGATKLILLAFGHTAEGDELKD